MSGRRILVVDDNPDLADGIRYNLELEGYQVRVAVDGPEGIRLAEEWQPDLIILDLMLPGCDGYEVLRAIRHRGRTMPVIILSARGEEADKVKGFRLDADQYVTKPVGLMELLARVRSLLRRLGGNPAEAAASRIAFGDVVVDQSAREVTVGGRPVTLTPKAFDLMLALVRRQGAVASRVELLKEVWGTSGDVLTRTVDSHMAELRKKLEPGAEEPRHFLTVWKAGYRFRE
ncbi:MAG TPA: response regulator transcription factor [Gemmatimonadales bacterium]|nr:response regulator transcription factor [Gemmatimonadales bacterium]